MKPMTLNTMLYNHVHEEDMYDTMSINYFLDDDDPLKVQPVYEANITEQVLNDTTTPEVQDPTYIRWQLGRPQKITSDQIEGVVQTFEEKPETTLREAKKETDISITSMLKILHEFDIKYFRKIAISKLTDQHKQKRVDFSQMMSDVLPNSSLNIIITDESTIEVDLLKGGIWRRRGHYPPGSFKEKEPHPIHVMVWEELALADTKPSFSELKES